MLNRLKTRFPENAVPLELVPLTVIVRMELVLGITAVVNCVLEPAAFFKVELTTFTV